jgi:hypothetical protein
LGSGKVKDGTINDREELVLKITKEILVKFIELGRINPSGFVETFKIVNETVRQSVQN